MANLQLTYESYSFCIDFGTDNISEIFSVNHDKRYDTYAFRLLEECKELYDELDSNGALYMADIYTKLTDSFIEETKIIGIHTDIEYGSNPYGGEKETFITYFVFEDDYFSNLLKRYINGGKILSYDLSVDNRVVYQLVKTTEEYIEHNFNTGIQYISLYTDLNKLDTTTSVPLTMLVQILTQMFEIKEGAEDDEAWSETFEEFAHTYFDAYSDDRDIEKINLIPKTLADNWGIDYEYIEF